MKNSKHTGRSFSGKGYYIALILCAAAIGISGYLYYRSMTTTDDPQLNDPSAALSPVDDVQADAPGSVDIRPDPTVEPTQPATQGRLTTCAPLSGETVCGYAMDCLSYNPTTRDWRVHNGIDIAAEAGTPVCAAAAGTVYNVYTDDAMGTTVVIRHQDGYVTVYASLAADVSVEIGDTVEMGQTIGAVGNTALLETAIGDHLHFSVTCDAESMDPLEFLEME